MSSELVRAGLASNPAEAEMLRGLLTSEGIESIYRQTDFGAGSLGGMSSGQQEILVRPEDLERAQALLDSPAPE